MAVNFLQVAPKGMIPYFTLVGCEKSINHTSELGESVVSACIEVTDKTGNENLINNFIAWILSTTISSLNGKYNQLSFPDANKKINNDWYQLLGGSCTGTIGLYCFDKWIIEETVLDKDIIRLEDYAHDSVVLHLASSATATRNIFLDSPDVGNQVATVFSQVFMRLQCFQLNKKQPTGENAHNIFA